MANFFIFSLPRCRTLWLSVLLTTDRSLCVHDTADILSTTRPAILKSTRYEFVGLSEPHPTGILKRVDRDTLEHSPKVVIKTTPDDSYRRTNAWLGEQAARSTWKLERFQKQADALDEISEMPNCLSFQLNELAKDEVVERIFKHCLPGLPYDPVRTSILQLAYIVVPYPGKMNVCNFIPRKQAVARTFLN